MPRPQLLSVTERPRGVGIMGVLNLTPDSFFDGGAYLEPGARQARLRALLEEGADIIDVGGESSRPMAPRIAAEEQLRRILPAVQEAVALGAVVSVDTTDPDVADAALSAGASLVNDVSNLATPRLAAVAARHGAVMLLNHSRGSMTDMRGFSEWPDDAYDDVVVDVLREWTAARERCLEAGIAPDDVWLDPGLGFSKNARHSLELLRRTSELCRTGVTLVVGPSRKSFIGSLDGSAPSERLGGSIAASVAAARAGAAFVRVHDVAAVRQAFLVEHAMGGLCYRRQVPGEAPPVG